METSRVDVGAQQLDVTARRIVVCDWDRYQHRDVLRGEGVPPWIKVYTRLHHSDEFMNLSGHRRAILFGLWIEYAMSRRKLSDNTADLSRKLGLRVTMRDLDALSRAGFIDFLPAARQPRVEESRGESTSSTPPPTVTEEVPTDDTPDRAAEVARRVSEHGWILELVLGFVLETANGKATLDELTADELARVEAYLDERDAAPTTSERPPS